jgi:hypothetical protein
MEDLPDSPPQKQMPFAIRPPNRMLTALIFWVAAEAR